MLWRHRVVPKAIHREAPPLSLLYIVRHSRSRCKPHGTLTFRRNYFISPSFTEAQVSQRTTAVINQIRNSDYPGIHGSLSLPLRIFLNEKRLRSAGKLLERQFGAIESFETPVVLESGKPKKSTWIPRLQYATSKTLVQFQRCKLALRIEFSPWKQILGIGFSPPIDSGLIPPWTPPAYVDTSKIMEYEMLISGGRFWPALRASLTLPQGQGPHPAVIMLSGSGGCNRDISVGSNKPFRDISWGLASMGIVTLRMEKPLFRCAMKTFITKNVKIKDEYLDSAMTATKVLKRRPSIIDTKRIFVLGTSLGGRVAPRVCKMMEDDIAGMISLAGTAEPVSEAMVRQVMNFQKVHPKSEDVYEDELMETVRWRDLLKDPNESVGSLRRKLPNWVPPSYCRDADDHDPVQIAQGIKTPMLLLQGDRDFQVPLETDFRRWQEALCAEDSSKKDDVTTIVYPGLNHIFMKADEEDLGFREYDRPGHVEEKVVRDIADWIGRQQQ